MVCLQTNTVHTSTVSYRLICLSLDRRLTLFLQKSNLKQIPVTAGSQIGFSPTSAEIWHISTALAAGTAYSAHAVVLAVVDKV